MTHECRRSRLRQELSDVFQCVPDSFLKWGIYVANTKTITPVSANFSTFSLRSLFCELFKKPCIFQNIYQKQCLMWVFLCVLSAFSKDFSIL